MPGMDNSDGLQRDPPAQADDGLAVTRTAMPGGLRVAFAGELDLMSVPRAVSALRNGRQDAGDVILDVRQLAFMDAAGLAVIVNAGHRARQAGHRFVILVRSPGVRRLLALARAERTLEIVVDDATSTPDAWWVDVGDGARRSSRLPGAFGSYVTRTDSSVHLTLWGEIDLAARPGLEAVIDDLRGSGLARLVVDLRRVEFLDSSGLGLVLELHAAAHDDGFELLLIPGPPEVQRIFEITRTADALPFVTGEAPEPRDGDE